VAWLLWHCVYLFGSLAWRASYRFHHRFHRFHRSTVSTVSTVPPFPPAHPHTHTQTSKGVFVTLVCFPFLSFSHSPSSVSLLPSNPQSSHPLILSSPPSFILRPPSLLSHPHLHTTPLNTHTHTHTTVDASTDICHRERTPGSHPDLDACRHEPHPPWRLFRPMEATKTHPLLFPLPQSGLSHSHWTSIHWIQTTQRSPTQMLSFQRLPSLPSSPRTPSLHTHTPPTPYPR